MPAEAPAPTFSLAVGGRAILAQGPTRRGELQVTVGFGTQQAGEVTIKLEGGNVKRILQLDGLGVASPLSFLPAGVKVTKARRVIGDLDALDPTSDVRLIASDGKAEKQVQIPVTIVAPEPVRRLKTPPATTAAVESARVR